MMQATEIADAFALTHADVTTLTHALKEARIQVMRATYQRCAQVAGVKVTWEQSASLLHRIETTSAQDAKSIAATYRSELERFIEAELAAELAAEKGWKQGGIGDLLSRITGWIKDRLGWKSQQIVDNTSGEAANDGVEEFLDDVDAGDIKVGDTAGSLWVGVVPDHSSSDFCQEYAGYMYPLEEADDIPSFPMHANCPHSKILISA